jgi:hypothetical protein
MQQSAQERLALIKAAADKLQAKQAKAFPTNTFVKATAKKPKGRKAVRNATAGIRSEESVDSFDESNMYDDEKSIQRIWNDSGVMDSYSGTTRYDNEWN